jgi:CheY-like chemotaxis protein
MVTVPVPIPSLAARTRTALVASADRSFRQRLSETLTGLRWQVREADGGAQAWAEAESARPEAVIVDSWLPDLDLAEFLKDFRRHFPDVDLLTASGTVAQESPRGPYRQELLYALRRSQDTDTAVWNAAPALNKPVQSVEPQNVRHWPLVAPADSGARGSSSQNSAQSEPCLRSDLLPAAAPPTIRPETAHAERLPELIGYRHSNLL